MTRIAILNEDGTTEIGGVRYKLVPVEPDVLQLIVGGDAVGSGVGRDIASQECAHDAYKAMLAAAQAVLPCGHHNSLMLKSAETGEPLYCELCDCISRRNDAEKMEAEARDAWSYATTLAVSMHRQHYAEDSPNWQPLTDLVGLLTQIDNMYAGLRNDLEALKVENKRLVGLPLATLMAERDALRAAIEAMQADNKEFAVEKMAASYDAMRNDRDHYKRMYERQCNANESLKRSNAALRGVIRKLKLKGAA